MEGNQDVLLKDSESLQYLRRHTIVLQVDALLDV